MTQNRLYQLSCRAARDLLQGLERGNLQQIEQELTSIRRYLALAEAHSAESLRGVELHQREQLELLGGITENLDGALLSAREKIAGELECLRASKDLLRHLVVLGPSSPCRQAAR